jgi:hypothetical protein
VGARRRVKPPTALSISIAAGNCEKSRQNAADYRCGLRQRSTAVLYCQLAATSQAPNDSTVRKRRIIAEPFSRL